jgi:hypothetical protein
VPKILTNADWLSFEIEQWRSAIHERGLKLESLDIDQRKLVSEATGVPAIGAPPRGLPEPFASPASAPDRPSSD